MQESKPIVFIDLETTGTSTTKDRIVELAMKKMYAINKPGELKTIVVNPGIPIPKGASDVHGFTDEMVKDKPKFIQYAKAVFEELRGCDIAGYNIRNFDLPLLFEEFARCGINWPLGDEKIFDSCNIFKIQEPRTLEAAVKFYCNRSIEDAHTAGGDVDSTIDVFFSQLQRYPDLISLSTDELDIFCTNGQKVLDVAGKIAVDAEGHPVYNFGKDSGKRLRDNPGFGQWMLKADSDFPTNTKNVVRAIIYKTRNLPGVDYRWIYEFEQRHA